MFKMFGTLWRSLEMFFEGLGRFANVFNGLAKIGEQKTASLAKEIQLEDEKVLRDLESKLND